jgi:O-antigen ligase
VSAPADAAPPPVRAADRLALAATCAGAALVPLAYLPPLEAPFLVAKFAVLQIAAALGFAALALRWWAVPDQPLWSRPLARAALLVLATTALAWAFAGRGPAIGAPYADAALARWGALFGIACGTSLVARDPRARRTLLETVTATGTIVAAIGLWQHLDIVPLPIPEWSPPGSTFGNRNMGAEAIALSLPLGIAALASTRRERAGTIAFVLALSAQAVYLAATRTRGAWLGCAAGVAVTLALLRPRLSPRAALMVLALGAVVVIVALLPGRANPRYGPDAKRLASGVALAEASVDPHSTALRTRFGLWRRSLTMWRERPLLGVGPGNWPVVFPRFAEPGAAEDGVLTVALIPRQAHDDLLERATETGAIGLAALLILYAAAAWTALRRARSGDTAERAATAGAAGTLAALIGAGVTAFPLEMPATILLAGVALGLLAPRSPPAEPARARASRPARRVLAAAALVVATALVAVAVVRAERQVRGDLWQARGQRKLFHDMQKGSPNEKTKKRLATEALAALEASAAATPAAFRVHLHIAEANLILGRLDDAELAIRRALSLEPWSPNAGATLALVQLRRHELAPARASAASALSLLHNEPLALQVTGDAAEMMGDAAAALNARDRLRALAEGPGVDPKTARQARALLLEREP